MSDRSSASKNVPDLLQTATGPLTADQSASVTVAKGPGEDVGASTTIMGHFSGSPGEPPLWFGRYQIVRRLGRGGMGEVFLALDGQLDRLVALKVPQWTQQDSAEILERFLREARAMARMRHANLCPVFDAGQVDGVHYLTMAYIEGRTLAEELKDPSAAGGIDGPRAAALVEKLARALHEAHLAGVIHRDLKPSNIMLDRRGEPIVMDFGLARREQDPGDRLTLPGAVVGTPAYIPPEQLEKSGVAPGPAADVYSLGVIFYQLLCGRLPFQGSLTTILAQILSSTPLPPSEIRCDLDKGLEVICLRAMARNPGDRYPTMAALAEALEQFRLGIRHSQIVERRRLAAERPALTAGFQHDLFVHYALADDEPPPGGPPVGWVSALVDCLEWRLRTLCGCGAGLSVWMDGIRPGSVIEAGSAERLQRSAAQLVIVSPAWLSDSDETARRNLWSNFEGRRTRQIFVEYQPIELSRLPAGWGDKRRIQFWSDPDGRGGSPLGSPHPQVDDIAYYAKIDDLARAVKEVIETPPAKVVSQAPAARQGDVTRGRSEGLLVEQATVFLAETTDDLDPKRDAIARQFSQLGWHVVPDSWLPREAAEFEEAVNSAVRNSVQFVQLLGPFAGKRPAGGSRSYTAIQCAVASRSGVPIVQWRDPALDPGSVPDIGHRALLTSANVMAIDFEEFKREAARRVRQEIDRRTACDRTLQKGDRGFVFINVDREDLPVAGELCRLLEATGCSFAMPIHDGRPEEIRRDLEANLLDCDGLIVVYGGTTGQWVREQLRQWRKMLYRRERPLRALAVYEGPPPEKQELGMRLPHMSVIDCRGGLEAEKIRAFVAEVSEDA